MRLVSLLFHDVYESDPRESGFRSPAADRYKLPIPEFEAQLDGLAQARLGMNRIPNPALREPQGAPSSLSLDVARDDPELVEGSRGESRFPVVITVDDGGVSFYTVVADRLEAVGLWAHCFVSTDFIGERGFLSASQIRELDARGHVIGTHSASHPPRFSGLTFAEMRREWTDSRQRLEDVLGRVVTAGSVPGGYFSHAVARAAAQSGLRTLFTSEPTARPSTIDGCEVGGRFTIRRGHSPDMAHRFTSDAPWARYGAWIGWNAKALVKPVLGASYARVADWILEANR